MQRSDAREETSADRRRELSGRYGPLAQALCGRALQFALGVEGQLTWTDGVTVFLNPRSGDADRRLEIAVQCGLLALGSFEAARLYGLVGRGERARRYLLLEAARLLREAPPLLQLVLGGRLAPPLTAATRSSAESLARSNDRELPVDADFRYGELRPARLLTNREALARGAARPEDLRKPPGAMTASPPDPELGDDEEADDVPGFLNRLMSLPFNTFNPLADLFRSLMGARSGGASDESPGAEIPTGSMRMSRRPPAHGQRAHYSLELEPDEGGSHLVSRWTYPEWDFMRGAYRPDWCVVHEVPAAATTDRLEPIRFRRDPLLEKGIQQLSLALAPVRRQLDGDELDLDAAVDSLLELAAGRRHGSASGETRRLYIAARRVRRDLGALVLIDMSGSSSEASGGGRSVLAEQLQTAAALTQALHRVGDRVSTLAFHSRGRDSVRAVQLKGFDQAWSQQALQHLLSLKPSGYTRLGAAIRHGTHRLAREAGTARRLLIVISDGIPYDLGYSGRYAFEDLQRALDAAAAQDVRILWLCFGDMEPQLAAKLAQPPFTRLVVRSYQDLRRQLARAMKQAVLRRDAA